MTGDKTESIPYKVSPVNCTAVERFKQEKINRDKGIPPPGGGGGGPPGGGSNPGGGANPGDPGTNRCVDHPGTPGCPLDCDANPHDPRCGKSETCTYDQQGNLLPGESRNCPKQMPLLMFGPS